MDITVHVDYFLANQIPPRCRKPRDVAASLQLAVEVAEIAASEAPVAFEMDEVLRDETTQWRLHEDQLYKLHRPWARQEELSEVGSKYFAHEQTLHAHQYGVYTPEHPQQVDDAVQSYYSDFLAIDGIIWRRADEPLYAVCTFGLGNNHGGTGLMVDEWVNPNIGQSHYFAADQYEAALAHAIEVALGRGDTKSVDRFEQRIRVLIPEAVRHGKRMIASAS